MCIVARGGRWRVRVARVITPVCASDSADNAEMVRRLVSKCTKGYLHVSSGKSGSHVPLFVREKAEAIKRGIPRTGILAFGSIPLPFWSADAELVLAYMEVVGRRDPRKNWSCCASLRLLRRAKMCRRWP